MKKEQFKQYVADIIREIEKHKWYESEKAGHNIGGNEAALDWLAKHYQSWKSAHGGKYLNSEGPTLHSRPH